VPVGGGKKESKNACMGIGSMKKGLILFVRCDKVIGLFSYLVFISELPVVGLQICTGVPGSFSKEKSGSRHTSKKTITLHSCAV
jgi:hypothetical protein